MKCYLSVRDEVWCNFTGLSPTHIEVLWNQFGVHVDGYFFMPAYKLGRWDGKIRFFEKTGKTYVRLLDKILPYIEKWGYDFEIIDNRKEVQPNPTVPFEIGACDEGIALEATHLDYFGEVFDAYGKRIELRPYQAQVVKLAVEAGSGFIVAGTGAGKTLITAAISHAYGQVGNRCITIVPSDDLVTQTFAWYEKCGLDVGQYSGTEKDINHTHVVATWQALQYNPTILQYFTVVIWDEAHGIKASVAQKLLNDNGKHIPFRFGVTGTFPKPECDKMSLMSSVGQILKEIPARWLIKHSYLAEVEIQPVEINETYVDEEFIDYDAEKAFLSKSMHRMEKIADLIISMCATHGNTLVLVNSIPFGKKLASLIKNSVFLYGESPSDLRKEHYDMFEERDDLIVIASSGIASTGISIDRIFCLMLIDPLKSFIKAIQSIGRGLRKGRDKSKVYVVDVYSKLKWARKHHKERVKYYSEAGYPVAKKLTLKVKDE
jgi:superfamily II DNA or RNA helicase